MTRPAARTFQNLVVWQKAHQFVLGAYKFSAEFSRAETYSLTQQPRRAAVSIPANIAEGFRRRNKPDKARFLNIAQASLEESRYYLILAQDLGYGQSDHLMQQAEEVSKILDAYARTILTPVS